MDLSDDYDVQNESDFIVLCRIGRIDFIKFKINRILAQISRDHLQIECRRIFPEFNLKKEEEIKKEEIKKEEINKEEKKKEETKKEEVFLTCEDGGLINYEETFQVFKTFFNIFLNFYFIIAT